MLTRYRAVTPCRYRMPNYIIAPRWSSSPRGYQIRTANFSANTSRPIAIPATSALTSTSIHQRRGGAPHAEAIELGPLDSVATREWCRGELVLGWHEKRRHDRPMADFTTTRPPMRPHSPYRGGGSCSAAEGVLALTFRGNQQLGIARGAGRDDRALGFATRVNSAERGSTRRLRCSGRSTGVTTKSIRGRR